MPQYLPLPNGADLEVPDGMGYEDAMAAAKKKFPDIFPPDTTKAREGFIPSLVSGARSYLHGLGYLGSMATGAPDEDLKRQQESAKRKEAETVKTTSMDDVRAAYDAKPGIEGLLGGAGKFYDVAKETVASSLPAAGGIMAGAATGARVGSLAGPWGTVIGGLGGGILGAMPAQTQQMVDRQLDTGQPLDRGAALAGAAGASALDVAEQFFVLGKLGVGKLVFDEVGNLVRKGSAEAAEKVLLQESKRSLKAAAGRGVVKGLASEVPVEVAQQVIERAQAGLPLMDDDALKEYKDTAYTMVGPGALFGGVGGIHGRASAKNDLDKIETQRMGEELAAKQKAEAEQEARSNAFVGNAQQAGPVPPVSQTPLYGGAQQTLQPNESSAPEEDPDEAAKLPNMIRNLRAKEEESQVAAAAAAETGDHDAMEQAGREQARFKTAREAAEKRHAALTENSTEGVLKRIGALRKRATTLVELGDADKAVPLFEQAKKLEQGLKQVGAVDVKGAVPVDLFEAADQRDQAAAQQEQQAQQFDTEQQRQQAAQAKVEERRRKSVDAWAGSLEDIEHDRAEAAAIPQRNEEMLAQETQRPTRPVTPVEPGVVQGDRVKGKGYSYPAGVEGASEEEAPAKVASPRYLALQDAVDEGKVTPELHEALGIPDLKQGADLHNPADAAQALPAIDARVNEVAGALESMKRMPLKGQHKQAAIRTASLLDALKRIQKTAVDSAATTQPALELKPKSDGIAEKLGVTETARTQLQERVADSKVEEDAALQEFASVVDEIRKGVYFSTEAERVERVLDEKGVFRDDVDAADAKKAAQHHIEQALATKRGIAKNGLGKIPAGFRQLHQQNADVVLYLSKMMPDTFTKSGLARIAAASQQKGNIAAASGSLQGLRDRGLAQIERYVTAVMREASAQRRLDGKAELTNKEASGDAALIKRRLAAVLMKAHRISGAMDHDRKIIAALHESLAKAEQAAKGAGVKYADQQYDQSIDQRVGQTRPIGTPLAPAQQQELRNQLRIKDAAERNVVALKKRIAEVEEQLRRRMTSEKTGEIEHGLDPGEVASWKNGTKKDPGLDTIRKRLVNPPKPKVQVAPVKDLTLRRPTEKGLTRAAEKERSLDPRGFISDKIRKVLAMPGLDAGTADVLQQVSDVLDANRGSRGLQAVAEEQADRILNGVDKPFSNDPHVRASQMQASLLGRLRGALRQERELRQDTEGKQKELFTDTVLVRNEKTGEMDQLQPKATVRASVANFLKFLKSGAVKALKEAEKFRQFPQSDVLDKYVAELKATGEVTSKDIDQLIKQMYKVRGEIAAALKHELPQSVAARLRKEVDSQVETAPWAREQAEEFEPELHAKLQAIATDMSKIESVYKDPTQAYERAFNALIKQHAKYEQNLRANTKLLEGQKEQSATKAKEAAASRAAEAKVRATVVAEREEAVKLQRALDEKIGSNFGLDKLVRTVEVAEHTNPKTGEKVVVREKETDLPIQRKRTEKQHRETEVEALERQRREGVETAAERAAPKRYAKKAGILKAAEDALAKAKAPELKKAIGESIKAIKADLAAMVKRFGEAITWQPQRPDKRVSAKAAAQALADLRRYGNEPGQKMRPGPLRTGANEGKAQAKAADKERREEAKMETRMDQAMGPAEVPERLGERGLADLGITFNPDTGDVFHLREDSQTGVNAGEAQAVADKITKNLPAGVKVTYAATVGDVPLHFLQKINAMGRTPQEVSGMVTRDGEVLVIGENHATAKDVESTFAHELIGHYGPDTILGPEKFAALSRDVWRDGEAGIKALAKELGIEDKLVGILAGDKALSAWLKANPNASLKEVPENLKLTVTRELVADTATYNPPKGQSIPAKVAAFMKKLVTMFRKAFGDLGMDAHAKETTQKIFDVLRQSQQAFDAKNIGPYRSPATSQAAFKSFSEFGDGADTVVGNPSPWNAFWGASMGKKALAAEVQFFDHAAAVSKATQAALVKEGLNPTDYKWAQMMYHIRAHQDDMHHATDVMSNGPKGFSVEERNGHKEYVWGGKRFGPSMKEVIEPLKIIANKGMDMKDVEKKATFYGLLMRSERVGLAKMKLDLLEDPAKYKEFEGKIAQFKEGLKQNPEIHAALKEWFSRYQKYNNGLLDMLAATDAMPQKEVDRLKALKDYIPFYRINPGNGNAVEMLMDEGWRAFGDITHQPGLQQLLGGKEQIMPFFASSIRNTHVIVNKALANQAAKNAAWTMRDLGMLEGGIQRGYGGASGNTVRFNVAPENDKDTGERHVTINTEALGIPSDLVVHGLRGVSMQMPVWLKVLSAPGNLVRKMVVRNPMFAVRQLYSDLPALMFTSGANINVTKAAKDMVNTMTGKNPTIDKLQEMGLLGGNVYSGSKDDLERVSAQMAGGKSSWSELMGKLDHAAIMADAFSRAHIFESLKAQGMSDMEAGLAAREALDFSRHGVSPGMRMLSSMIPFFNTQLQSLYALGKALSGKMPYEQKLKLKQKFWTRGLMMSGMALAYASSMEDDDTYKKATPAERYYYWFVHVPGFDEPLRIRVPFEAGIMFKSLPEAMYQLATSDTTLKEAAGGIGKAAWNSNPFAYPPAVKAFIEQTLNVSTFTGQPLEDHRMQKLDPALRYRANTTETAKAMGRAFGVSPVRLENLINTLTTGTGMAMFSMMDPLVRAMADEVPGAVDRQASKMPLIGSAFQPADGMGLINSAYDMAKEMEQRAATFKALVDTGKTEQAKAYAAEYGKQIALGQSGSMSTAFDKRMADLKKQERAILEAPESKISPERKRELLHRIRDVESQLSSRVRDQFLAAGT